MILYRKDFVKIKEKRLLAHFCFSSLFLLFDVGLFVCLFVCLLIVSRFVVTVQGNSSKTGKLETLLQSNALQSHFKS